MKLFKEVQSWLRGYDERAAAAMADPVRDGRFAIEDAKKEVGGFTSQIAKLVAGTKELQHRAKDAQASVEKFESIATKAGKANDAAGVKEALTLKARSQAQFMAFQHEIDANTKLETNLRAQLQKMQEKINNAESDSIRLEARITSGTIRAEVARNATGAGTGKGLGALDDLSRAANKSEAEAEAWEDMAHNVEVASGDDLIKKYDTSGNISEEEIAKYIPSKT